MLQQQSYPSINNLINKIMSRLGASHRSVEIDGLDIGQILVDETLPIYSKYFPYIHLYTIQESDCIPGTTGEYYLKCPFPILSVADVVGRRDTRIGSGGPTAIGTDNDFGSTVGLGLVDTMALNDLSGMLSLPVTTQFNAPNTLEIFPKDNYVGSMVKIRCIHPYTLHTIGWTMFDQLFNLALQDVYIQLRAILKKFETINSIHGEISINFEEMDAAEDKRNEILEKFRAGFLKTGSRKRWIVA